MPVFEDYARYYNLLYRDKNYSGEVSFVLDAFREHGLEPDSLLDLGCGTGRHALEMASHGIRVTGVDMSETMLAMGRMELNNASGLPASMIPQLHNGDARSIRLGSRHDAAVSLFHVMSYQTTENDALAIFTTAREHLGPGGLFFFDFWHGAGVLRDLPERRERVLQDAQSRMVRIAEPVHRVNDNIIEVHYRIKIAELASGEEAELRETHNMRYWFIPELRYLAGVSGFEVLRECGWMHHGAPGLDDWNAWMLFRATNQTIGK